MMMMTKTMRPIILTGAGARLVVLGLVEER
jgi:hypothetical protein